MSKDKDGFPGFLCFYIRCYGNIDLYDLEDIGVRSSQFIKCLNRSVILVIFSF